MGLALMINLSGCAVLLAGAAGGAGTAYWLSGKLSEEVNVSYERAIYAAEKAVASLNMKISKETKSDKVTQIKSNYTDGSDIWIDIRPLTEKSSKIEVRIGLKGDKEASVKILEKIKKYL